jgi:ABC-type sugar transport system substrate-binding protein
MEREILVGTCPDSSEFSRVQSLRRPLNMKLTNFFLPVIAMMAIALGTIPAHSAPSKIKIGVAMSNFDDVWLTYVRDAITKWASAHPDVELIMVDWADDTA